MPSPGCLSHIVSPPPSPPPPVPRSVSPSSFARMPLTRRFPSLSCSSSSSSPYIHRQISYCREIVSVWGYHANTDTSCQALLLLRRPLSCTVDRFLFMFSIFAAYMDLATDVGAAITFYRGKA